MHRFVKELSQKECEQVSGGDISSDPLIVSAGIVGIIIFIYGFAPSGAALVLIT